MQGCIVRSVVALHFRINILYHEFLFRGLVAVDGKGMEYLSVGYNLPNMRLIGIYTKLFTKA